MDPQNQAADDKKDNSAQRDAATRLVRDQLDALYNQDAKIMTPSGHLNPQQQKPQQQAQPHQQQAGHQPASNQPTNAVKHLEQYHTQWQDYYQKYYESYYVGHLHEAIKEQERSQLSPEEAKKEDLVDLRQKIIVNAKDKAKKARKSRHFIPLISSAIVVVVVAFLQYNQIIIANVQAYVSPGAIDPQNIVIDPGASTVVSADPRLIIPKINVDVPVIYNVGNDHAAQMAAMLKGVAHFSIPGANSTPGQIGNTVLYGHSSNDVFDPGDYKFIFVQLDKVQVGDTILVNYNSTRYTYTITKKQVVKPNNVDALMGYTDKPYLTLITCTPIGTALNRLLVTAEQVSPDPSKATAANTASDNSKGNMPGNSPTIFERLFGAN